MNILSDKYISAFFIFGMLLLLIPGFVLYILGITTPGVVLMLVYVIPCLLLALVALIMLAVEFIRDWKDFD